MTDSEFDQWGQSNQEQHLWGFECHPPWPPTHLYEAVASLANDFYIQKLTHLFSHVQNLFFVSVQEAFFDARNRFGQFCVHLLLKSFPSKSVSQWYMEVLKRTGQGSPQSSDPLPFQQVVEGHCWSTQRYYRMHALFDHSDICGQQGDQ